MPSKVGIAADQPSARPNQHKAITIQDLKNQTAIRLQQEHQQNQVVTTDPRTSRPVVTPQTLAARRNAQASVGYGTAQPINPEAPSINHYQRLHHLPAVVHHVANSVDAYGGCAPQYYDRTHKNLRNRNAKYKHGNVSASPLHSAPCGPGTTGGRYHPDQHVQYLGPTAPTVPTNSFSSSGSSSAYNEASSNQGTQASSSSKLPHGLTVHELKEMTKARLQAEAAEKLPVDVNPNVNGNGMGMEDGASGPFNSAPLNTFQPVHLQVQSFQSQLMYPEQNSYIDQPAEASPPSPVFHTLRQQSSPFPYESASQDPSRTTANQHRIDSYAESNWENASVTSHNSTVASDYLGSESAFSSGYGGGFAQGVDENHAGLCVNRTQSHPVSSRESTPTSLPSPLGSSYFESSSAAMASNRQRAVTLSPRPGLSLLHEDRPGFSDDALGIPSFASSSRQARQQLQTRSRRSFSPILHPQGFSGDTFATGHASKGAGVIGGGSYDNRPRTSSAVSLPTISHTAEEFSLDGYGGNSRRSSDGVIVEGTPIQKNDTCSLAGPGEHIMSSSSFYGSGDRSTSSVFRDEYGRISAPPGLGLNDGVVTGTFVNPLVARTGSVDGSGSENTRVRASTWVAGGDMFGSSVGLYESSVDDTLAGDLASILKLSGAEEKDDTFPA